tara:strand:- start:14172 stop:14492 length:321 start_codon:yes stop_codon:yes gene_type:complete
MKLCKKKIEIIGSKESIKKNYDKINNIIKECNGSCVSGEFKKDKMISIIVIPILYVPFLKKRLGNEIVTSDIEYEITKNPLCCFCENNNYRGISVDYCVNVNIYNV